MLADPILDGVRTIVGEAVADTRVPVGAFSAIQRATMALRTDGGRDEQVRLTEDLSIALLRLEWGLRRRDGGAVERARELLKGLREQLGDGLENDGRPSLA